MGVPNCDKTHGINMLHCTSAKSSLLKITGLIWCRDCQARPLPNIPVYTGKEVRVFLRHNGDVNVCDAPDAAIAKPVTDNRCIAVIQDAKYYLWTG